VSPIAEGNVLALTGRGVYVDHLIDRFPPRTTPDESALQVYRSALAKADSKSVTIAAVGHATNLLDLLSSGPDSVSPLSGLDLIRQKVDRMVIMAGRFNERYIEWNVGGCGGECGGYDRLGNMTSDALE
jgi:inosine-uridine nucleoside N-ribohydrolase